MIDVIIIGAGPAGLTLGAELASRGITCKIYEKRLERSIESRAIGLLPHTLELLEIRNLATTFIKHGLIIEKMPLGNGKFLKLNKLKNDTKFPFMLCIPQSKTESLLEDWALSVGVEIIKGVELLRLKQEEDKVCVTLASQDHTWKEYAKYVMGCDGKKSIVRSLLGIHSAEISYNKTLMHGDMKLKSFDKDRVFAKISKQGMIAAFPLPNNYYRVLILDHKKMCMEIQRNIELENFKESTHRLARMDLGIYEPLWLSSFNTQQIHANNYRVNKVFLLGDAAHTHIPAGGQGLQSAIEDAFNLGWKLANSLQHTTNEFLLDSYEYERRQIAAAAMFKSNWLFRYEISNSMFSYVLRKFVGYVALIPILQKQILRSLTGLASYYKLSSKASHSLIGKSVLNKQLCLHSGLVREIRDLLRNQKGIFLSSSGTYDFSRSNENYCVEDLERIHGFYYENRNIKTMIIRSDGIVAWVSF